MYDLGNGLCHGLGIFCLENVTSHIHAVSALTDSVICHAQCLGDGQLLATGNDDRNRTSCGDLFEILAVIALNQLSAQLGDNASGQREELGIAGHLFSDSHN